MLMMRFLLRVAFILPLFLCNGATPYVGFRIWNATLESVNGIYICSSDSRCTSIVYAGLDNSSKLLTSTNAFVNGAVQKRWFISESVHGAAKTSSVNLYGAIELAAEPVLHLKEWKRLGTDAAFEPSMQMEPITVSTNVGTMSAHSLMPVLESAQVLLAAYQHLDLVRTSDHGRYILSALHTHHRALLHRPIEQARDLTEEERSYIELFNCDYQTVLGADADKCYHDTMQRLHKLLLNHMEEPVSVKLYGDHHYSALHCASNSYIGGEAANCHLQYAAMRRARHLLLHAVDPVQTLNILQNSVIAVRSEASDVWQLLSCCLLGMCTNRYLSVATHHSIGDVSVVAIIYESPTAHITITVDTIVRECDAILANLQAHGDNDVVHALFTKTCFPFHQVQHRIASTSTRSSIKASGAVDNLFTASKRTLIDQSRTMVATLLSVGAVELAAVHTANVMEYVLDFPVLTSIDETALNVDSTDNKRSELVHLLALYRSLTLLVLPASNTGNSSAIEGLLRSPNVRAALQLSHNLRSIKKHDVHWRAFLGNSDLLGSFLNTMFHATSPVILSSPGSTTVAERSTAPTSDMAAENSVSVTWLQEAVLFRYIMVHTLRILVGACNPVNANAGVSGTPMEGVKCEIIDPASSVGARGLFLIAYQGLGLTAEALETAPILLEKSVGPERQAEVVAALRELSTFLRDSTVPTLYQDLLRLSSSEITSVPPFSSTPATTPQTTAVTVSSSVEGTLAATTPRRIKVAFLSFFFRRHPVGRLLVKVIANLNHSLFEVHIVTIAQDKSDDVTAYLHQHIMPEKWIYFTHNMVTATQTVRSQQFDVIIYGDVFMDANMAHFATIRLAPVQVCFWGHPFTTGYESMDYFITSDKFEQKQAHFRHNQYSEQLVRFDSLSFQLIEPEVDPADATTDVTAASIAGVAHRVDSQWRWPDIPMYTLRGTTSLWDQVSMPPASASASASADPVPPISQSGEHNQDVNQEFFQRRHAVLRWVTSIGFDIHNMPINDADLIDTLHAGSTDSHQSTTTDLAEAVRSVVASVRLYGALQSLFKMHPLFDLAIAEILTRDEHAWILLSRNGRQRHWEQSFRERLATTLRSYAGLNKTHFNVSETEIKTRENNLLSRVLFVNQMQHTQYQTLVCSLDVTLDTFPFGGGVTLSDALGGCGLNTQQTLFHNGVHDIYHRAVPFVTSGQLQSVHQIGAGMAEQLGPDMTDFVHSTATGQWSAEHAKCLHNGTSVACVGKALAAGLETTHMQYIREYAKAAVALATESQVRKLGLTPGHDNAAQKGACARDDVAALGRINEVLYNNLDVANEWSSFLQNVVGLDQ